MARDWSDTLNLPRTEFPMKANLPEREPAIQARWRALDVYGRLRAQRRGRPRYVLHDGPPYANGDIHVGTALNKVLKDIVVRFHSLLGYDAPYVPGWDTHGLPIERRALEALGVDRRAIDPLELRAICRRYALQWVDRQREQFLRLGVLGDWERPYLTLDPAFEAEQVRVFGEMARRGYIYRDRYSVYWCTTCETALAEAEVEYREKESPSIFVAFPVVEGRSPVPAGARVVIWTTTPWTLPANVAIAYHPEVEYALVETPRGRLVLAGSLCERVLARLGVEGEPAATFPGRALEGVVCRHPWLDRQVPLVPGEHVSAEEGTGLVHTAPGHGAEDFEIGRRHGLPVLSPVDDRGVFTAEAGAFAGMFYADANAAIVAELERREALLAAGGVRHSYPHCWRCKQPVIFRATTQWFASIEGFREQALAAIREVRWIPAWGEEQIASMVRERAAWCISRQRHWGVPIPAFHCEDCGAVLLDERAIEAVASLFAREGSDAWYRHEPERILPEDVRCPGCGGRSFRKETDTMDVWFDSGSTHAAVLAVRDDLQWPADLYLEGPDQYRGWYQSSLLTAVATRGRAPYRAVLTNGWVVDAEGREMHKSLGNVVDPLDVIRRFGADVLRLWVAASDYRDNVSISDEILARAADGYRKIRNTLRFCLGNLYDFDPARDAVHRAELQEVDRWVLARLAGLVEQCEAAYRTFEFHRVYHAVHGFCAVELSSFYLDVVKDRLYAEPAGSRARRAAQTVLHALADALLRVVAPLIPHTADEAWQHLPRAAGEPESVHLALWPEATRAWRDPQLVARWEFVWRARADVGRALERARREGAIHEPAQAAVALHVAGCASDAARALEERADDLATLLRVAEVRLTREAAPAEAGAGEELPGLAVVVARTQRAKCARCWRYAADAHAGDEALCDRCAAVVGARA